MTAGRRRAARLTVNYRTPKPAMALAAALLPPGAEPPVSGRDSGEAPWCARHGGDLAGLVRREAELTGTGRVAVIALPAQIAQTAAALGVNPGPDPDAPVTVLWHRVGARHRMTLSDWCWSASSAQVSAVCRRLPGCVGEAVGGRECLVCVAMTLL